MGAHFFSPANVMKLLENVRGSKTSDLTIATLMAWGKQIGKWPILVGNCPGFVGNRLIGQYSGQAAAILASGALPSEVDAAIEGFGNKMGTHSIFYILSFLYIDLLYIQSRWACSFL
jgi:3-hydroxyacyl-CoA dehydrogenase